jgi:iron complex outermembrane receptor protein
VFDICAMKKIITFSLVTFLCALNTSAQENGLELDPVTVTASLQAKNVSQTGRNIISFKGDQFNNLPIRSIDELLRYLPGLEVQMRGPMGAQSDIVLRGGTFQQVLVLLDGVRINDPNTGHFSSYIPIAPSEIDHIELLKGASSAIYGSEAVGGVVHIITKTFAARSGKPANYSVTGQVSAGEYDLFALNLGASYQNNKTTVAAGFLSNNTNGQLQRGTRGGLNNNTASLSITQLIGKHWQLSARVAYDNRDFSAQNFYTTFASDTANELVRTLWSQVRLSYVNDKHHVSIDAGYKDVLDEYAYNKVSVANSNKSKMLQTTIMDEWKMGTRTSLVSGVQFINKDIRSNDRGDHSVPQGGAFVVLNQVVLPGFVVNPALRLDWNDRSGFELIPQVNLSYKYRRVQFRGSAGKTIRDADFTERFNNYNKVGVASGRIGNPDLRAETSFSYEAGADYFAMKKLRISGTFFQRFHERLIDYVTTPYAEMPRKENLVVGGTYALAENISKVNTTGTELDVQYQFIIPGGSLYAGAGLVWLSSSSSSATPSFYISSHAKFLTNFFVNWSYKNFLVSVTGVYKQRGVQSASAINASLDKAYFVVNAKAAAYLCKRRLNIFIQEDNLGNTRYSDLLGAVMPGRWLSGGIGFTFAGMK